MMQTSLSTRLRVLRAERGLTIRAAAELTGVAKETLSDLERGTRYPQDLTLAKIAKGYNIPVEELLEPVLSGKAEAPGQLPPLGHEARAPREGVSHIGEFEVEEPEEGAAAEWRHLRQALVGSWSDHAEALHARFAHLLNELPESPSSPEWNRGEQAINDLLTEFHQMQEVLAKYGVGQMMRRYLTETNAGQRVTDADLAQPIVAFYGAQRELVGELIPRAIRWARRTDEADRAAGLLEKFEESAQKSEESGLLIR